MISIKIIKKKLIYKSNLAKIYYKKKKIVNKYKYIYIYFINQKL